MHELRAQINQLQNRLSTANSEAAKWKKQYETFETSSGSTQVVASLSSMEHIVSSLEKLRKENQIITAEKIQHAAESVKLVRRCRLLDNAELDVAASKLYQDLQSQESERIKSNMANLIHPITNKDIRNELRPRFLQQIVHVDHITVIRSLGELSILQQKCSPLYEWVRFVFQQTGELFSELLESNHHPHRHPHSSSFHSSTTDSSRADLNVKLQVLQEEEEEVILLRPSKAHPRSSESGS